MHLWAICNFEAGAMYYFVLAKVKGKSEANCHNIYCLSGNVASVAKVIKAGAAAEGRPYNC